MSWTQTEKNFALELAQCTTKERFDQKLAELRQRSYLAPVGFWKRVYEYYKQYPKTRIINDSVNATVLFDLDSYIEQVLAANALADGNT